MLNTSEGVRRLSLFVGLLGALAGLVFSYAARQAYNSQFEEHEARLRRVSRLTIPTQPNTEGVKVVEVPDLGPAEFPGRMTESEVRGAITRHLTEEFERKVRYAPIIALLVPLLGFLIPWTGIRSIAWVVAGFRAKTVD
jgi:hypothetical protein